MFLPADHDPPIARDAVRAARATRHRRSQIDHAGRLFPAEGAREVTAIPRQADDDLAISAGIVGAAQQIVAGHGVRHDRSENLPFGASQPDSGLTDPLIECRPDDRLTVAADGRSILASDEHHARRGHPVEPAAVAETADDHRSVRAHVARQRSIRQRDHHRLIAGVGAGAEDHHHGEHLRHEGADCSHQHVELTLAGVMREMEPVGTGTRTWSPRPAGAVSLRERRGTGRQDWCAARSRAPTPTRTASPAGHGDR